MFETLATENKQIVLQHSTLNLNEAANFLGIHKETLRQRATNGEIPGAKVGKCWRFLEIDLVTYLRSLYSDEASQGVNQRSRKIWHSTNEMGFGGSIYPTKEGEYEKALGLLSN